jgi:hypothetical protein
MGQLQQVIPLTDLSSNVVGAELHVIIVIYITPYVYSYNMFYGVAFFE